MKKLLLVLFLVLGALGAKAQSNISVFSTNPDNVYIQGEVMTYSVMVTNTGPQPAANVLVFMPIPAGIPMPPGILKFWWSGSNGSSGTNINLSNTINTLAVNQTVTYTINIRIPSDYELEIGDVRVTYASKADLEVINTNNQAHYTPGESSEYTVTVTNHGPEDAYLVRVQNAIPAGVANFSWSGNEASGTTALNNIINVLPVGETVTYTVSFDVPATYTGDLTSTTALTASVTDPVPGCPQCADTDTAAAIADIDVVYTDNKDTYIPGEDSVYTVTITNNGPDAVESFNVLQIVPAGVTEVTWTGSNGTSGTGPIDDTIPVFETGQVVTYTVTVTIPEGTTGDFHTVIFPTAPFLSDPDPVCTFCSDLNTLEQIADIVVVNTNSQFSYNAGEQSVYTVTVTNEGPADAVNVEVSNAIPAGITGFSWTGTNGSDGTNTALSDNIALMTAGQTVTYTITMDVPAGYNAPSLISTTIVTSDNDPDDSCALCTDTDNNVPLADIVVVNTNNQQAYTPGTSVEYTLTVTNNGPEDAENVSVANAMPAGITAFSWTGSNGSDGTDEAVADVIPVLAAGETVTYTVTLAIPADYDEDAITSQAVVTSDTQDPVTACENCTDTDYNAANAADIVVVNTDNSLTYTAGEDSVYTVTVTNNGPADAVNISVLNAIPAGITDFSWSGSNGSSGTDEMLEDTIATLANGDSVTYTITVGIPAAYEGDLVSTASATSLADPDTACALCTDTNTDEANEANLVVTNTNGQDKYTPGTTAEYTLTLTNEGPDTALDIDLSSFVSPGIATIAWTGSNGTSGTGAVADNIAALAIGESVTYTVTLEIPLAFTGDLVNTAIISAQTTDPVAECPGCSDVDTAASANIVTEKTLASGTQYTAGTDAIYTITVTNEGPDAATGVLVQDMVPAGLPADDAVWTGSNGTSGTGNLTDTIATLALGETVTYTFTIPVPSGFDQETTITNTVTVTSTSVDPVPACDDCTVVATPNPQANIVTLKTNGQDKYLAGEQTTYTITITNPGPSDAHNISVSDPKPVNIQMMTWEGNDAGGSGAMQNTINVLPAGESVVYTVTMFVPENYPDTSYLLRNVVTVTSETPDPVPACLGCIDEDTPRGKFVTVTQNQYSIEELVRDVLIDVQCIDISNVNWNGGPGDMGIGYFHRNNSTFPVKNGIIMHTGNCMQAGGPNTTTLGGGGWGGDGQLLTYMQAFDPGATSYNDVSRIEFDFIPLSSNMSFEFVFASEEYGDWQCSYSDAFAFFLTHVDSNVTTNLALVPSTTTPIAVTTIRNAAYNGGCGSVNAGFFGAWYGENPALPIALNAPINFDGRTVLMTAASQVEAGDLYHIKLVIGDRNDSSFDSAVFLAAGSFDIGQPTLPEDITIATGNALCPDEEYVLEVDLTPGTDFIVTWEKDGEVITDINDEPVTTTSILVTEPGIYTVLAAFPSAPECNLTDTVRIEYRPEIEAAEPEDLTLCGNPAETAVFDLTDVYEAMMEPLPDPSFYEVFYFNSMEEIINEDPNIPFPQNFVGNDGQTIYVSIMGYDNSCKTIRSFDLHIVDCNVPLNQPQTVHICEDAPYDAYEIFDLTSQNDQMMAGLEDPSQYVITYHNTLTDAETGDNDIDAPETYNGTTETIFVRAENIDNAQAYGTTQFNLIVTPQPFFEDLEDVEICDSYVLPVFEEGDYFTGAGGTGTVLEDGTLITASQTIYRYKGEGTATYGCNYENSFEVIINETPEVDTPDDVQVCGSYILPALASGEYFDAENNPVTAGTEITETQVITISAQTGTDVICSDTHTFTVTVNNAPVLVPATALEQCDEDFDGFTQFDLVPAAEQVVNGATGLTITYHSTLDLAQSGVEDIEDPSAYPSAPGSIFIRAVEEGTTTNCYSVEEVQLIVYARPAVPQVENYVVCDDNNSPDGIEIFDLTSKNAEATTDPEVTVTYYTSLEGAEDGQEDRITGDTAYESGNAQVWVRVESDFGCYSVSSFELVVNPLPLINTAMEPFYACEEEPGEGMFDLSEIDEVVTMGASGVSVKYYATLDEAAIGGDETALPDAYLAGTSNIYARIEDGITECVVIGTVALEVLPAPIATDPAPLNVCDPNNDEVAIFNLDPILAQIEAQLGNVVTAVPFETYNDAFYNAVNNIIENTSAYTNIEAYTSGGVQPIYIRVESDQTDCFDIVTLQLVVQPVPEATKPQPYAVCDNGSSDTDGIGNFDLTTRIEEILGDIDPAFPVTFFETEEDAIDNIGGIQAPASYNSPSDIIFAKVTNTATGCYDIVELELIVNPLPVANPPAPLTLCDLNAPGDEIEVFDLNTKIDEIITTPQGVQDGIIVTFFKDYDDAVNGTGVSQILTPEAYTNAQAVETIFVRVTIEETGCYRIVLLDVRVEPVPVLVMPTQDELTACDTTGLGIGEFDLQALIVDMVNGAPNLEVTFHTTYQDAIGGDNPITEDLASYHNINPFLQYLYVRVVNPVTGCVRLEPYTITLIVEPAPQAPEDLEDLVMCDDQDNNGGDGKAYFDLTVQDEIIHTALGTDDSTLTIEYFTTLENANFGSPRITNPVNYYGSHGQTIWVRVETPGTECFSVTSFQLELHEPLTLTTPSVLAVCNEELVNGQNDAVAEFDLTVKDDEILGDLGIGQGMTVTYFEIDPRVDPAAAPIADPAAYTNPGPPMGNPKTLYVMVTTKEGCKSYTTLTIKVLPLPVPDTTPDALRQCDVNSSPDGMEIFDLTDAAADIRNGDAGMVLTYYETEEDAHERTNLIADFTAYNSGSRTIWVRAEANTQNAADPVCYQVVSFEIIVDMLPALGEAGVIPPYAICEQDTDGIALFDFNTHMDEILGETTNPDDYTVKFFSSMANVGLGIAMPYIYTNTSSPNQQNIFVQVVNNETECTIVAPLTLLVEEAATAYPVTETFFECDYDGTNDGVFTFDLTRADDDALGPQSPSDYSVTYYTTAEDAEAGTNAIASPTAFQNTPDYQMVWVRVTNESTVSGCYEVTTMELFVERIPEPAMITDHTTVCINFETGQNVRHATIDSQLDATHTFVWYKDGFVMAGETGPTLLVYEPGSYDVIATSATGCVSDPVDPIVIEMSGPASIINDGYVVGNPFGENQVITVLVQGYGEYQFRLDDGPWQNSNVFEDVSAYSVHTIYVRDVATADPCDDLELILELGDVSVIDYPNFFTPNGDGYNDYWNIFGLNTEENKDAKIYIFDRFGKLMKQISAEGEGWDGTFNGTPAPATDYWFTVEFTIGDQKREYKAHFALKR
ncbi:choice-of-anchor L domain-containing protein [uncultured Flavobacterium sp.]|uniref:choice-of-anchor L domain-containing protein n=1 Tax=uncultured Flavobacterium sp. TaxID=165435 RepID=UPI0025DF09C9|nr:choice-of-anchor L domain-containing protein [uncultured Flavobacterium sp.]